MAKKAKRKLDHSPVVKVYSAKTGKFKRFEDKYGGTVVTGTESQQGKCKPANRDGKRLTLGTVG